MKRFQLEFFVNVGAAYAKAPDGISDVGSGWTKHRGEVLQVPTLCWRIESRWLMPVS